MMSLGHPTVAPWEAPHVISIGDRRFALGCRWRVLRQTRECQLHNKPCNPDRSMTVELPPNAPWASEPRTSTTTPITRAVCRAAGDPAPPLPPAKPLLKVFTPFCFPKTASKIRPWKSYQKWQNEAPLGVPIGTQIFEHTHARHLPKADAEPDSVAKGSKA